MATAARDRFRVTGPAESYRPLPPAAEAAAPPLARTRAPGEARPLFTRAALLSRAAGSAYVESGRTRVVAAVMGPRQARRRHLAAESAQEAKLSAEFKFAPFACAARRGWLRDAREKELSLAAEHALRPAVRVEQYPHCVIDVFVRVLECDGEAAALAAGITAAGLALADARVELCDLVVGAAVGATPDNTLLLDCDAATEESALAARVVAAYLPSLGTVTQLAVDGVVPPAVLAQAVELCIAAATRTAPVVKETLAAKFGQQDK